MTAKTLDLGEGLRLPAYDAQTQTMVVYGGKGMGKTVFGAVLAEELARARLRFSYLDPVGVGWGLAYASDGKGPGIELLRIGGARSPDIKLVPSTQAAEATADLVAEEDVSTLIDISRHSDGKMWSKGEKIRFVRDYTARLFMRQGERRRPLMQIIDEAGRFVPQQMPKGAIDIAECVGNIEELVELGRNVGIGVALITQRSARMNKSVSELAEMMVAFRTVGPNSIDAIMDWFGDHVPKPRQRELIERVRQLPQGTALLVSPGWLGLEGEYAIRMRHTFDSSATPKSGTEHKTSGRGAEVDREKYIVRMAEVEEKANAENPAELRKQLAAAERRYKEQARSFERELADARKLASEPQRVEVPVVPEGLDEALVDVQKTLQRVGADLSLVGDAVGAVRTRVKNVDEREPGEVLLKRSSSTTSNVEIPQPMSQRVSAQASGQAQEREADGDAPKLKKGARRMLDVLATFDPQPLSRRQLGTLANVQSSGGTFSDYLSSLRGAGYIRESGTQVGITNAGRAAATTIGAELTTEFLVATYGRKLKAGARRMLDILVEISPDWISRAELGERASVQSSGGTFSDYLSSLRRNDLIEENGSMVRAGETLFLGAS
jgi:hypothetical protein